MPMLDYRSPLWILPAVGLASCIITTGGDSGSESSATEGSATSSSATDGITSGVVDETAGSGPTANERCDDLCDALIGAACDNGPTEEGCVLTCEALTSSASCDASAQAYMDCVDTSPVSCSGQGEPFAEGCGLLYLAAIGCAVTENPNPDLVEPCEEYCGNVAAAECPASSPSDDCSTNCLWLGATGTGCDEAWGQYVGCFNDAMVSCVLGFAVAEGCGADFESYWSCINMPE